MKPVVIYPNNQTNTITLTKEEFEKYLNEAYEQGKADGKYQTTIPWIIPNSFPTTTYEPYVVACDKNTPEKL